jgi:hypothetical protein
METFPREIKPKLQDNFPNLKYERFLAKLREEIVDFILIRKDQSVYFPIDIFFKKHNSNDPDLRNKIITQVMTELRRLTWKCTLSFGDTGLFIYTGDKPTNCWDGSF